MPHLCRGKHTVGRGGSGRGKGRRVKESMKKGRVSSGNAKRHCRSNGNGVISLMVLVSDDDHWGCSVMYEQEDMCDPGAVCNSCREPGGRRQRNAGKRAAAHQLKEGRGRGENSNRPCDGSGDVSDKQRGCFGGLSVQTLWDLNFKRYKA